MRDNMPQPHTQSRAEKAMNTAHHMLSNLYDEGYEDAKSLYLRVAIVSNVVCSVLSFTGGYVLCLMN